MDMKPDSKMADTTDPRPTSLQVLQQRRASYTRSLTVGSIPVNLNKPERNTGSARNLNPSEDASSRNLSRHSSNSSSLSAHTTHHDPQRARKVRPLRSTVSVPIQPHGGGIDGHPKSPVFASLFQAGSGGRRSIKQSSSGRRVLGRTPSSPSILLSKVKDRIRERVIGVEWPIMAAAVLQEKRQKAAQAFEARLQTMVRQSFDMQVDRAGGDIDTDCKSPTNESVSGSIGSGQHDTFPSSGARLSKSRDREDARVAFRRRSVSADAIEIPIIYLNSLRKPKIKRDSVGSCNSNGMEFGGDGSIADNSSGGGGVVCSISDLRDIIYRRKSDKKPKSLDGSAANMLAASSRHRKSSVSTSLDSMSRDPWSSTVANLDTDRSILSGCESFEESRTSSLSSFGNHSPSLAQPSQNTIGEADKHDSNANKSSEKHSTKPATNVAGFLSAQPICQQLTSDAQNADDQMENILNHDVWPEACLASAAEAATDDAEEKTSLDRIISLPKVRNGITRPSAGVISTSDHQNRSVDDAAASNQCSRTSSKKTRTSCGGSNKGNNSSRRGSKIPVEYDAELIGQAIQAHLDMMMMTSSTNTNKSLPDHDVENGRISQTGSCVIDTAVNDQSNNATEQYGPNVTSADPVQRKKSIFFRYFRSISGKKKTSSS